MLNCGNSRIVAPIRRVEQKKTSGWNLDDVFRSDMCAGLIKNDYPIDYGDRSRRTNKVVEKLLAVVPEKTGNSGYKVLLKVAGSVANSMPTGDSLDTA